MMLSSTSKHDSSSDGDRSKRAKHNNHEEISTPTHHPSIMCLKGRQYVDSINEPLPKEYVLHLPPRLTKSAYQTLISTDCVARPWHLEGRYGSRTHVVEKGVINGIPIIVDQKGTKEKALQSEELKQLMETEDVNVVEKEFVRNHRTRLDIPEFDATMHPELKPEGYEVPPISPKPLIKQSKSEALFTYAELFGGIGGFGVALDALGGICVFYSEIEERCRETYVLNFNTPPDCIHGDICKVPDTEFPKDLDMLVGGFPCQPFSKLGEQPGFDCHKGRGQLFLEIVRLLGVSRPRCFLLENVPGLQEMKEELEAILKALREAGYYVKAEICSARGLVATKRKRLFFAGIRNDLVPKEGAAEDLANKDGVFFQFPYIPDLKLCCHDILDYEELPQPELEILRVSSASWNQLNNNKRWRPHHLAWPNAHCEPLTSHYGNSVGRGESQLVPSCSPYPPRRFSVRETARIMGFPNSFVFCPIRTEQQQGEMAHRKEGYRMCGNAVCPPLIAALAGSVLAAAAVEESKDECWTTKGRRIAVDLACAAIRGSQAKLPAGSIVWMEQKKPDDII
ncbi:hypothetical protein ACHAWO_002772 [Cyclotella atomus]|uniref:Cytosine-specific methyltransferase n=1 Tax=Cyclotella atomus TaxID=382360 RepID=A0ABD3NEQ2_9STRA